MNISRIWHSLQVYYWFYIYQHDCFTSPSLYEYVLDKESIILYDFISYFLFFSHLYEEKYMLQIDTAHNNNSCFLLHLNKFAIIFQHYCPCFIILLFYWTNQRAYSTFAYGNWNCSIYPIPGSAKELSGDYRRWSGWKVLIQANLKLYFFAERVLVHFTQLIHALCANGVKPKHIKIVFGNVRVF